MTIDQQKLSQQKIIARLIGQMKRTGWEYTGNLGDRHHLRKAFQLTPYAPKKSWVTVYLILRRDNTIEFDVDIGAPDVDGYTLIPKSKLPDRNPTKTANTILYAIHTLIPFTYGSDGHIGYQLLLMLGEIDSSGKQVI